MEKSEHYKGHVIEASTRATGRGYAWSYVIDGGQMRFSDDRSLPSEELMLSEAISRAKSEIDALAR